MSDERKGPLIERPQMQTTLSFTAPNGQALQLNTSMTIPQANAALKEAVREHKGFFILEEPPSDDGPGAIVVINLRFYAMAAVSTEVKTTRLHQARTMPGQ